MSGGPVTPFSAIPATRNVFRGYYVGTGGTPSHDIGMNVLGAITSDAVWRLRFTVPRLIPSGFLHLRILGLSNSSSGKIRVNPKWAVARAELSPSGLTLSQEGVRELTFTAADVGKYQALHIYLDAISDVQPLDTIVLDLTFEASQFTAPNRTVWQPQLVWLDSIQDEGVPASSSQLLKWNPNIRVPLTNPSVYNIPAGTDSFSQFTHTLAQGEHAIYVMPSTPRKGKVRLEGTGGTDNRIHVVSGQFLGGTAADDLLNLAGIDHAYLEGIYFNKNHAVGSACAFATRNNINGVSSAGAVWMQHCLFSGINYADTQDGDWTNEHGDHIIFQHPGVRLRMHLCSGFSWNTSFIFTGTVSDGVEMYQCDWNIYDSRFNPKHIKYPSQTLFGNSPNHSVLSSTSCASPTRFVFEDVYWFDHQPVGTFPITDSNGTTNHVKRSLKVLAPLLNSCTTAIGDPYTGELQINLATVTGRIKGGIPPEGHYVNPGTIDYGSQQWPNAALTQHVGAFNGIGYSTPGYME
jgi:hypothetical protein